MTIAALSDRSRASGRVYTIVCACLALLFSAACADPAVRNPERFASITTGLQFTCALDDEGQAWCWGANRLGQLGIGDTLDRFVPTALQHSVPFRRLMAGETHVCAIDTLDDVHCWGDNDGFALGDTAVRVRARPGTVDIASTRVLAAGARFNCVITRRGETLCWGSDQHGERGDEGHDARATPTKLRTAFRVDTLVAGRTHACALDADGRAYCWGHGGYLGDSTIEDRAVPTAVAGDHRFRTISAGESVSCAIDVNRRAWCWGLAHEGQLGDGLVAKPNLFVPVAVTGNHSFQMISAGHHRVCALDLAGVAWCWGSNVNGGLGNAGEESSPEPVRVQSTTAFVAIAAGDHHTCALDTSGAAWCWGQSADVRHGGALGDGTVRSRSVPTAVGAVAQP